MSSEERAKVWDEVIRYCENYLEFLEDAPAFSPFGDKGKSLLNSPISEKAISIQEALNILDVSVDHMGHNTAAPGFLSYIPISPVFPAILGDLLAAVTSRYAGHFHAGPGAVRMEDMVLNWMADLVGFPKGFAGNLTSGGSMANLSGIVCARTASKIKARDFERSVIYMTEHAHHCLDKSLRVAGLDECIVRRIPVDQSLRMDSNKLNEAILADKAESKLPMIIIATAGTTDSGSIDPLDQLAAVARRHNVWLHVDGAYGGLFSICAKGKQALKGIGESDSLALDPPKGLYVPWGCGAVLVREGRHLYDAFQGAGAYMNDVAAPGELLSPSDLSFELSKLSRGLKIWLPLKLFGTEPFAAAMDEKLLLARYAWDRLGEMPGFERGSVPDLSIVLFRYVPSTGTANELNEKLIEAMTADGRVHMSSTRIKGNVFLRLAILGYRTHQESVDLALNLLQEFAADLEGSSPLKV